MLAQVAGIALDEDTIASVVAALGSGRQPVAIDRARIDRQMRELALAAAGTRGKAVTISGRLRRIVVLTAREAGDGSPTGATSYTVA